MHKVKRAIIMAAGIGKRMQPVSLHTPKPLIKVNGVRMIDTVISGLHQNGITEIYIVVGYLKEAFAELPKQYPGVVLIENMLYETCNNISSLYAAREHLEDVIILDGDQIIYNPTILTPEFERSGYNCVWCEGKTDEWLLTVENGVVTHCGRNGGEHGWQLFSISRWNKENVILRLSLKKRRIVRSTGMMLQCFATRMSTNLEFIRWSIEISLRSTT